MSNHEQPLNEPVDRRLLLLGAGLAGVAALSRISKAGPIDPPAGPVASTGVTLQQVSGKLDGTTAQLSGKIDSLSSRVAKGGAHGAAEDRLALEDQPGSATAVFSITLPGAYYLSGPVSGQPGLALIEVLCDDVDIDLGGFSIYGVPNSGPCVVADNRQCIELYDGVVKGWTTTVCAMGTCTDCCVTEMTFRQCTCTQGFSGSAGAVCRLGARAEVHDCSFTQCSCDNSAATGQAGAMCICGPASELSECDFRQCVGLAASMDVSSVVECCTCVGGGGGGGSGGFKCADSCSFEDCSAHMCVVAAPALALFECGNDCAVSDCHARQCSGLVVRGGARCVVECFECTGGTGAFCLCDVSCSVEDCTVAGRVLLAGGLSSAHVQCGAGSCVTELDVRDCAGLAVSVGSNSVIECCEVTGGSGGAFMCADGCCCDDNSVALHDGMGFMCGPRCSLDENRLTSCRGMEVGAECVVCGNELTNCDRSVGGGGTSGGGGSGGAIQVAGPSCLIEDNCCRSCRPVSIYVAPGSDSCHCEDNSIDCAMSPQVTAGMQVDALGCLCLSNTVTRCPGGVPAFALGQSVSGPVVLCTMPPGTGLDLSTVQHAEHICANYVVTPF